LSIQCPSDPIWLKGDIVRLAQMIANLLDNAAKYTPEQGQISVSASLDGNQVEIVVRDTGIGIPPDQLAAVFDELGFAPDPQARGLAFRKSFLIGLVYDNPNAQYIVNLMEGVLERPSRGVYVLADADFTHPTMAEGLSSLFSSVPPRATQQAKSKVA
jgi:hypothetical protein